MNNLVVKDFSDKNVSQDLFDMQYSKRHNGKTEMDSLAFLFDSLENKKFFSNFPYAMSVYLMATNLYTDINKNSLSSAFANLVASQVTLETAGKDFLHVEKDGYKEVIKQKNI